MSVDTVFELNTTKKEPSSALLPIVSDKAKKMVLVHAIPHQYSDSQRHVLLVRKPELSPYHPGCLNLPGGHVESGEAVVDAAIRELSEETGLNGTWPQYMGCIRPPEGEWGTVDRDFIVYIYRAQVSFSQKLVSEPDQPANWYALSRLARLISCPPQMIVPNLTVLLSLLVTGITRGWTFLEPSGQLFPTCPDVNFTLNVKNPAFDFQDR